MLAAVDTTKQKHNPVLLSVWWVILNPEVTAGGSGPVLQITAFWVCFWSLNQPSSYMKPVSCFTSWFPPTTTAPAYHKDYRRLPPILNPHICCFCSAERFSERPSSFYKTTNWRNKWLNLMSQAYKTSLLQQCTLIPLSILKVKVILHTYCVSACFWSYNLI